MNEIVLRKVKVVDPGGPHHDSIVDILIRDGRIEKKLANAFVRGDALR
ncbi:MAG: hypothetical protein IPL64_15110 [Flavobacteriales bacterium]|nr:hypothetical protein [Flavobacteriales bacterium]